MGARTHAALLSTITYMHGVCLCGWAQYPTTYITLQLNTAAVHDA